MGMFLLFLPAIVCPASLYPVRTMVDFFQWITLANPVRHFLEIVRGIFLKGHGLGDIWPQLLVLTAMAAAVLFAATRRFRRTIA